MQLPRLLDAGVLLPLWGLYVEEDLRGKKFQILSLRGRELLYDCLN